MTVVAQFVAIATNLDVVVVHLGAIGRDGLGTGGSGGRERRSRRRQQGSSV